MSNQSPYETVRQLVAAGDIEEALTTLNNSLSKNSKYKEHLIILQSQYNDLRRSQMLGILSTEDGSLIRSRLVNSLLTLTTDIQAMEGKRYSGANEETELESAPSKSPVDPFAPGGRFYFGCLTLSNTRCYGNPQTLNFIAKTGEPSMWNVIIGDNGTGKTTLLKALALSLLFHKNASPWKRYVDKTYFQRTKEIPPLIGYEIVTAPGAPAKAALKSELAFRENELYSSESVPFLTIPEKAEGLNVFAYGAARQIGQSGLTTQQEFPAISLFDEYASLINAEEWLIQEDYAALKNGNKSKSRFNKVKELITSLLHEQITDVEIKTEGNRPRVMFQTDYGWVDLHNLSLGYRTLIAWTTDFAKGMFDRHPDSPNPLAEPAILLIDEIDLHLHPKLQQDLMEFLTETFPKTQFIVTAHSPLVIQSAEDGNIILLKKDGNEVKVENNPETIRHWRVDQILTSDLFGLESARPKGFQKLQQQRVELLSKQKLSSQDWNDVNELESKIAEVPVFENQKDRTALSALDKIAEILQSNDPQ